METQSLNSLIKYLNYSITGIEKELKDTCPDFQGNIKEQIAYCPDKPLSATSCLEATTAGSGVYRLKSKRKELSSSFLVYCMEDDKGGDPWTVVLRRAGNDVGFEKDWAQYEDGFGNAYQSYWLGLKKMYALMDDSPHELWIELQDFDNNTRYAKYDEFVLGDEKRQYALIHLGEFDGNAGDSLSNGHKFSSKERVNDGSDGSSPCASTCKGSWWFKNQKDCGPSNLNGEYFENGKPTKNRNGIYWESWLGSDYSYKYAHMAIRKKI